MLFFVQAQQDRDVAKIVDMGFSVDQANTALRQTGGNMEHALDNLLRDPAPYPEPSYPPHSSQSRERGEERGMDSRERQWEPRGGGAGERGGGIGGRGGRGGMDRGKALQNSVAFIISLKRLFTTSVLNSVWYALPFESFCLEIADSDILLLFFCCL